MSTSILKPRREQPGIPANVVNIFGVGGQSNADGRNNGTTQYMEEDGTVAGIQMYNYVLGAFANWKYGTNSGAFTNNSSLYAFDHIALKQYRDWLGEDLHVVKCTRGNTSFKPGDSVGSWYIPWEDITTQTVTLLSAQTKERIDAVRKLLALEGKVAHFKAWLWHQGEGDVSEAASYQSRMETFIANLRRWTWNPALDIIMGTISHASASYDATIEAAQIAIAAADEHVHLVDLSETTLFDGNHFDAESTEYFGNQVFEILKTL